MLGLLLVAGCPREAPPESGPSLVVTRPLETAEAVGAPVGPGVWTDPHGLRVPVPPGWSGRTGPAASSLLLALEHEDTGTRLEVWAFAWSGDVGPRPRPHCAWHFTDAGSHRRVPVLSPAVTGTCLGAGPTDPVVEGWYGRILDREIHVEVVYPAGSLIEGRLAVEPLLAAIEAGS